MAPQFYFSKAAIVIPSITGSVSFLSSGIVIYVIARSRVFSTYHRIMLGTSVADCIASLAIALTTLPMPRDVIYPFAGHALGNVKTCEVQGLSYLIGNCFVFCMTFLLDIFYLYSLTNLCKMMQDKFQWIIEVPLFIASLLLSLLIPLVYFGPEAINPSPNDTFCSIYSYPQGCTTNSNSSCRGGDIDIRGKFARTYVPVMVITFATVLITMVLIVISFHNNERRLRKNTAKLRCSTTTVTATIVTASAPSEQENITAAMDENNNNYSSSLDGTMLRTLRRAQETKGIVTRQALMYIGAFFFSHGFTVLSYADLRYHQYISYTEWIAILRLIFQPLQGFFNMLIFLHHKVYSIRRDNPNESFSQALYTVFVAPKTVEDPVVSSIEIVMLQEYANRKNKFQPLRHRFHLDAETGSRAEEEVEYNLCNMSLAENVEESVNSDFDYVSGVNDSSYQGSQPTSIQTFTNNNTLEAGLSSSEVHTVSPGEHR